MGTRSGDLDPGVLIYLMREKQFDAAMLEDLVDHRSGLVGISAISSDMRRLHDAASRDPGVRLAIKMFCYSVRKQIAAMIAVLDGIDMIVFTGGIGENDGEARASICAGLSWVGINLDPAQDLAGCSINDSASHVRVRVFASQENKQIARHAWALSRPGLSQ